MKKLILIISLVGLIVLAGCQTAPPEHQTLENEQTNANPQDTESQKEPAPPEPTATLPPPPEPTETLEPTPEPTPIPYPGKRGYHRMVFDSESELIFLYGGIKEMKNGIRAQSDCWAYDTDLDQWALLDAKCSHHADIVYDSRSDRIIIYKDEKYKPLTLMGESYSFDLNISTMENLEIENTPFGYSGAGLAYDSESDQTILFGGVDYEWNFFNDTYAFHLGTNTWEKQSPATVPPARFYPLMAYHPTLDRVIMFSGILSFGEEGGDVTWLYDYNTDTWSTLNTAVTPIGRYYSAMVYVSSLDQVLMFGGGMSKEGTLNDTWVFDHVNNTWFELSPESAPSARGWHAMAYDSVNDKVVLFGGGESEDAFTNETWIYDPQSNTWTNVTP
jgi:N-acetylneuraminic acid mutarotase